MKADANHTHPDGSTCPWCAESANGHDAGMRGAQAASDADPVFAHLAQRALAVVRNRHEPFTAAEIVGVLEGWGVIITRPSAIGAVLSAAHRGNVIRPNGDFVPSPVKRQHGRPLRVWEAC